MLVVADLVLAGITTLSCLMIIADSKLDGVARAWIVVVNAWIIVCLILSAISLMG